ncbi:sigma-70 family RNA polymerase sigma factor [Agrobacterium vitis]|uniref:Sigma-70 family RNA polymerase sigma factor n=1 Tax=Agrobacterium vitis TaxID=373 RepID=A0ABD6G750_AGRVI|nr:sigma-70 family RNA polymerase sigma factor [Agrobacterium vitis]MUO78506.1 sigma-70 family RNA polymerase sigma factor [Agrobacterium vitis]MUO95342.1 sigma-70 family RNA polymerase sigma factor [Agrobacterium vitis]MUP04917.1 sigma-70 family RNA polymerase sigma factor [Agrobacterium vitis]MUZ83796.1 sigma-70 family RNA polymerase sigma factor [Agrobacterium vitis]MVA09395.1 sigma-70 family RNA polymerase sigma factor [Agrobacterium vitis]
MIANISQSTCDEQIKTALMNKSKLLGAARRITGCASLAEDIVQEVLLQLVAKPLPPDIAVPASYMMRMVRNLATDHMRRLRYERGLFAVEEEGDNTSDYGSPEEHLREVEAYQAFCCTMEAMPARTRKFYEDHFFEGVPQNIIARQAGVSCALVCGLLRDAHAQCLAAICPDGVECRASSRKGKRDTLPTPPLNKEVHPLYCNRSAA